MLGVVTNWKGPQIALRAFVSLCRGLWWGGVRYCCGRLSEGLYGGLRAILVFQRVGAISIEIMMTMRMGDMTAIIDSV